MQKIIDFHTHLAIDLDKFLKVLNKNNIEKAIVIPYNLGPYGFKEILEFIRTPEKPKEFINNFLKKLDKINEEFLDQVKGCDKIIPAPWFSPESDNLSDFISKVDIIKFIPVFDNVTPDYYSRIESYVEQAVEQGKIIMIHSGWGAKVKPIGELASRYPKGKFVMAHLKEDNDFEMIDRLQALSKNKNLYCETSYGPGPHRIEQLVKARLGKRMLYGSDYRTSETSLKWYIAQVTYANIKEEIKEDILYNNAISLLQKDLE